MFSCSEVVETIQGSRYKLHSSKKKKNGLSDTLFLETFFFIFLFLNLFGQKWHSTGGTLLYSELLIWPASSLTT